MGGRFSMPRWKSLVFVLMGASLLCLAACGKKDDGRLQAFPVYGKVTVDGQPGKGVYVFLNPATQPKTHGIYPTGVANENGEYWVSTYDAEDGAPLGEYTVTAKWPQGEGLMVYSESPDRLRGRYADPAKSSTKITVKEATRKQPNEIPPLELSSK